MLMLDCVTYLQFNIANPSTGTMKVIDIDDEKKLAGVYDKRMGHEFDGETLGDEFKGYIFRCGRVGRWRPMRMSAAVFLAV